MRERLSSPQEVEMGVSMNEPAIDIQLTPNLPVVGDEIMQDSDTDYLGADAEVPEIPKAMIARLAERVVLPPVFEEYFGITILRYAREYVTNELSRDASPVSAESPGPHLSVPERTGVVRANRLSISTDDNRSTRSGSDGGDTQASASVVRGLSTLAVPDADDEELSRPYVPLKEARRLAADVKHDIILKASIMSATRMYSDTVSAVLIDHPSKKNLLRPFLQLILTENEGVKRKLRLRVDELVRFEVERTRRSLDICGEEAKTYLRSIHEKIYTNVHKQLIECLEERDSWQAAASNFLATVAIDAVKRFHPEDTGLDQSRIPALIYGILGTQKLHQTQDDLNIQEQKGELKRVEKKKLLDVPLTIIFYTLLWLTLRNSIEISWVEVFIPRLLLDCHTIVFSLFEVQMRRQKLLRGIANADTIPARYTVYLPWRKPISHVTWTLFVILILLRLEGVIESTAVAWWPLLVGAILEWALFAGLTATRRRTRGNIPRQVKVALSSLLLKYSTSMYCCLLYPIGVKVDGHLQWSWRTVLWPVWIWVAVFGGMLLIVIVCGPWFFSTNLDLFGKINVASRWIAAAGVVLGHLTFAVQLTNFFEDEDTSLTVDDIFLPLIIGWMVHFTASLVSFAIKTSREKKDTDTTGELDVELDSDTTSQLFEFMHSSFKWKPEKLVKRSATLFEHVSEQDFIWSMVPLNTPAKIESSSSFSVQSDSKLFVLLSKEGRPSWSLTTMTLDESKEETSLDVKETSVHLPVKHTTVLGLVRNEMSLDNELYVVLKDLTIYRLSSPNGIYTSEKLSVKAPRAKIREDFVFCLDNQIHVFGRYDENEMTMHVLELSTLEWETVSLHGNGPTDDECTPILAERTVHFLSESFDHIYSLNLGNCSWKRQATKGDIPSYRHRFSLNVMDEELYLYGGQYEDEQLSELFTLDLLWMRWAKRNVAPRIHRCNHVTGTLQGSTLVVVGGDGFDGSGTSENNSVSRRALLLDVGAAAVEDATVGTESLCWICYEESPNAVFLECGHGGVCLGCARKSFNREGICPLCREDVEQIVMIQMIPGTNVAKVN